MHKMAEIDKKKYKKFKKVEFEDEPKITPELVEEMKKIEKEPIIYVKNLKKHFED